MSTKSKKSNNKSVVSDGDSVRTQIKAMEAKKRSESKAKVVEIVEKREISFDEWYSARMSKIPKMHRKEIIKADFIGRKVPSVATVEDFDVALSKYGVKL